MVNRESPTVATVVDRQFVENLPLNGRSFQVLLELTPGVTLAKSSLQSTGQFSVNGQRTNANYFMVDGVGANFGASLTAQSYQQGAGTQPALSVLGGFNNLVSVDALQEFRVQTSGYDAQYGRSPGAQVSITTRSGGNQFTGSAFNYFRNEALDAADFFDNLGGIPKRKLRQNDFGGTLGGPVRLPKKVFGPLGYDGRDRTFFFASVEQLRLVQPQAGVFRARVPSLAAREAATG
ncbi:MAG: Plug domain-containing protein [Acidobacteriota bacterium]